MTTLYFKWIGLCEVARVQSRKARAFVEGNPDAYPAARAFAEGDAEGGLGTCYLASPRGEWVYPPVLHVRGSLKTFGERLAALCALAEGDPVCCLIRGFRIDDHDYLTTPEEREVVLEAQLWGAFYVPVRSPFGVPANWSQAVEVTGTEDLADAVAVALLQPTAAEIAEALAENRRLYPPRAG